MVVLDPFIWLVIGVVSTFAVVLGATAWFTRGH